MKAYFIILSAILSVTISATADDTVTNEAFEHLTSVFRANVGSIDKCTIKRAHMTGVDGLELYGFYVIKGRSKVLVTIYGEGEFAFQQTKDGESVAYYHHEMRESDWDSSYIAENEITVTYSPQTSKISKLTVSENIKKSIFGGGKTTVHCNVPQ